MCSSLHVKGLKGFGPKLWSIPGRWRESKAKNTPLLLGCGNSGTGKPSHQSTRSPHLHKKGGLDEAQGLAGRGWEATTGLGQEHQESRIVQVPGTGRSRVFGDFSVNSLKDTFKNSFILRTM
jgi:hypothetical protein